MNVSLSLVGSMFTRQAGLFYFNVVIKKCLFSSTLQLIKTDTDWRGFQLSSHSLTLPHSPSLFLTVTQIPQCLYGVQSVTVITSLFLLND